MLNTSVTNLPIGETKMALVSPGVEVQVIDESFYTPAAPGTTPIIFVASAENKLNGAGTGTAVGTTKANAGKVYLMTSQRDLVDTFGDPFFYTDNNNNPIHGGEQNEYGLQAAYSYLGVSNRAYVVRADVDLAALNASATPTSANPADGTYWLDTQSTAWGIFEWDGSDLSAANITGQSFSNKTPIVINDTTLTSGSSPFTPKTSVGQIGDYAITAVSTIIRLWYKSPGNAEQGVLAGTWVEVGSANWKASWPSTSGTTSNPTFTQSTDAFQIAIAGAAGTPYTITATTGTSAANLVTDINTALDGTGVTAAVVDTRIVLYNDGSTAESFTLTDGAGTPLATAGIPTGEHFAPALQASRHTDIPLFKEGDADPKPTGSVWVKTTQPNFGARWRVKQWNEATGLWDSVDAPHSSTFEDALYELDRAGGGSNLSIGDLVVLNNVAEADVNVANFTVYTRKAGGVTTITSQKVTATSVAAATYNITIQESLKGQAALSVEKTVSVTCTGATTDADLIAGAINSGAFTNVVASVDSLNRVVISHNLGGDIRITDTDGVLADIGFSAYNYTEKTGTLNLYSWPGTTSLSDPQQFVATLWTELTYTANEDPPTALAEDGALWYSSVVDEVDILVHNGDTWVGLNYDGSSGNSNVASPYYNADSTLAPDPEGPIVAASAPANGERSDGQDLVTGDIWISTADLENYPRVYRWNNTLNEWIELDTTDQTTENGVLFADARYNTNGVNSNEAGDISALMESDYLDPDAPDPALYPKGMLLWNLRRSGFNVKRFERNYIDTAGDNVRQDDASMADYYPHRWVTESANEEDGSGSFGRKAQRKVVVQKLQALVNSNEDIRDDESRIFNLIATPGYPELIGEMVTLNYDRNLTAFVVGDTPARLTSDGTSLNDWAANVRTAVEDNDNGAVSFDEYMGMWYPWGFTSDNAGNNVVVPPSHMVLRTIALNDQVAYPWFAPAGTRRGGVTNATSSGYVNREGEFVPVALNEGQRDTLYQNSINPITFLTGAGLVVFGQKTRARNASALDRVNVARLIVYMRTQLARLAKPYLFEPNDKITRDEIKGQVDSLLTELVGLRALYDFLVVCDETNNTPARIDRNELYVDVAIEPVKAVEFIYIPLRIKNTGEIAGL